MHRAACAVLTASLILAACGGDDPEASPAGTAEGSATSAPASDSAATDDSTAPPSGDATADTGDSGDTADPGSDPAPGSPDGTAGSDETDASASDDGSPAGDDDGTSSYDPGRSGSAKPDVEIPDAVPDELDVTTLEEGEGPAAAAGDTLIVDYVGVRSADGVEFDNSYERGQPLAITLGTGGVIRGWDEGLVGARAGERRQLDIPSDLAYGPQPRGEVIRENEALTFVVDVRTVVSSDPADAPATDLGELDVEVPDDVTEVTTVELIEGDGDELEMGDTAVFHFVLFRADNGVALDSTWSTQPIQLPLEDGNFPGLLEGLPGMRVGGQRAIVVPPEQGFGEAGNPQLGLPADTDIVIVADLLARY